MKHKYRLAGSEVDVEIEGPENAEAESSGNLPSPSLLAYYQDAEKRIYWLGDIDDNTLDIIRYIMIHNHEDKDIPIQDRNPIKLFINSAGGDVQIMWSVMNAIQMSKTPVITINYNMAMSAAAMIFAAGHKRLVFPGSTTMIHNGSERLEGTTDQVESARNYYKSLIKCADAYFCEKTNIDIKTLKKKGVNDWYLDADTAIKLGVADAYVDNLEVFYGE